MLYSGFLFPDFFAFHHIRTINIPANEPPREPVISKTLKKAFFIFDVIITEEIISGIKQAKTEESFFFNL